MTNGQMIQAATLEQTTKTQFVLAYWVGDRAYVTRIDGVDHIDDAIAHVNTFLQLDLVWVRHVIRSDFWISFGVEE